MVEQIGYPDIHGREPQGDAIMTFIDLNTLKIHENRGRQTGQGGRDQKEREGNSTHTEEIGEKILGTAGEQIDKKGR